MRLGTQLGILFVGFITPMASTPGQDLPDRCSAVDSILGVPSSNQQRAPLVQSRTVDGQTLVRTGTRTLSKSGVAIMATWSNTAVRESLSLQLEVSLPTARVRPLLTSGDTILLVVDSAVPVSLGVPTPPQIASARVPSRLPVSVRLFEDDLGAVASARTVVVRYGKLSIPFDKTDLAASNKLFRVLRCAQEAAERENSQPPTPHV